MRLSRQRLVFGLVFAGSFLTGVCAVAFINCAMDPYGVFGARTVLGVNALKPRPDVMVADIKFIVGTRSRPDALILGNSRAEVGFDPAHPVFQARGLRAFNAAVPGVGIQYAADALQRFAEVDDVRLAVVGVDFLDFLYASDHAAASRPSLERTSSRKVRLLALFSTTALADSVRTFLIQRQSNAAILRSDGFNPMLDYIGIAQTEGYSALFRQRAQESAVNLAKQPHNLYVGGDRHSPAYGALRTLLRTAGEHRIDLQLVIYPYHVVLMSQLKQAGLWPLFETWKADVAALADEARQSGVQVSLWDFACPDAVTAERVPAPDDRKTAMRWYWEAGHFKKELGDRILGAVLDDRAPLRSDGFGFKLNAANVSERNAACRSSLGAGAEGFSALIQNTAASRP